jgi:nicotinate-nucleotide adenylyltransferase
VPQVIHDRNWISWFVSCARLEYRNGPVIALFGGTFDPVHFGHLRAAWEIKEQLQADDFRFLPAGIPPHREKDVTEAKHRLEMLRLALADAEGFSIDASEIRREGPSYMVDTLTGLRLAGANLPLALVIGQDSANTLDQWHRWRDLFDLTHLVVMNRPGKSPAYNGQLGVEMDARTVTGSQQLSETSAGMVLNLSVTAMPISSSGIRTLLESGKSPRYLLPAAVLAYIEQHGLYR